MSTIFYTIDLSLFTDIIGVGVIVMQENVDYFDRLVGGLSVDDRVAILQQMKNQIKPEIEALETEEAAQNDSLSGGSSLENESVITRMILFFKSLFSQKNIEVVYIEHKITALSKKVESKYSNMFSAQNMSLEKGFCESIMELKKVATFFKPSVALSDEHSRAFLVLLGSLIMSDLETKIDKVANPYSVPFTQELSNDLRASLLRKMEGTLAEVSQGEKAQLYTCVQSLIWLKTFTQLPFESFAAKFSATSTTSLSCSLAACSAEIDKFSSVLCNAKKVEPEVLEALYLFQAQSRINAGEKVDIQAGVSDHMNASLSALKGITRFINTVPLRSISMISHRSTSWMPMYKESGEDWFVQFKAQWKTIFDKKWASWLHDRKKAVTKEQVSYFFETNDYPLGPNRPWAEVKTNYLFSKEYTLGFINAFFKTVYPKYNEVLKILLVDGEFIRKDNKTELVDTLANVNSLFQSVQDLNTKLSIKGSYGDSFSKITADTLRTIQGQLQVQTLMQTIESETSLLSLSFGEVCRAFTAIFGGLLIANYNPNYDTISNMATLTGPDNAQIRNHLVAFSEAITTALALLQEIESIELSGPVNV